MAEGWHVATTSRTQRTAPLRDRALGRLAARQHGVVALSQLRELGLSASAVRSRVAAGRLHPLHRGVYAVGHPLVTMEGRWLAAVLACGPGAVLSHRSAAALWGLRPTARATIDVTAPRRAGRKRDGIAVHSDATLAPADCGSARTIPCTTPARTLLDLAATVDRQALERACDRAEVLRLMDIRAVHELLVRAPGRCGAPLLRSVLGEQDRHPELTRSELEERFLALCRHAGLPRPEVNVRVEVASEGVEVDFVWRTRGLIVETDGHATHGTRRAFERDRERDRHLMLAGWRVVRFTWCDVSRSPAEVASTLRALLERVGP